MHVGAAFFRATEAIFPIANSNDLSLVGRTARIPILSTDVYQFLSYWAGRTKTPSFLLVLPTTAPARRRSRDAHICASSSVSVEFDGFRLDMGESRERFVEAAQDMR